MPEPTPELGVLLLPELRGLRRTRSGTRPI